MEDSTPTTNIDPGLLEGVAIIGMAGRFPGAPDIDAFWKVLVDGRATITHFNEDAGQAGRKEDGIEFVGARGVLEDAALSMRSSLA